MKKTDIAIIHCNRIGNYQLLIRKKILLFFYKWYPLTVLEAEGGEETPIEFHSLKEAEDFISEITK